MPVSLETRRGVVEATRAPAQSALELTRPGLLRPLEAALAARFTLGAASVDAEAQCAVDLSTLWGALVRGHKRVVSAHGTADGCALVLVSGQGMLDQPMSDRDASLLQRFLLGESQKSLGMEIGLCTSRVATILACGLSGMGVSRQPSRAPLLLLCAAHAARGTIAPSRALLSTLDFGGLRYELVRSTRPEVKLLLPCSAAEREVVTLLMDGLTHAEIARLRATSQRTVANQIAAIYRKLGASGRLQLAGHLLRRAFGTLGMRPR